MDMTLLRGGHCTRSLLIVGMATTTLCANAQPIVITEPATIAVGDTHIGGVPLATAEITVRGTTLTVNGRHAVQSLRIEANASNVRGVLTHAAGQTFDYSGGAGTDVVYGFQLSITGDFSLQGASGPVPASVVDVDARGFAGGLGPGAGQSAESTNAGGGGYGGAGSNASGSSAALPASGLGGDCYGFDQATMFSPGLLGSGGGNYWSGGSPVALSGGRGGGSARLVVLGNTFVGGSISARGANGTGIFGLNAGGGSGGSVSIASTTITGTGSVFVTGGNGASSSGTGGGGGGGRIALVASGTPTISITTDLRGGTGPTRGGAGTLYTQLQGQTRGNLTIDNADAALGETTEFFASLDKNAAPLTLDANLFIRRNSRLGPARGMSKFDLHVLGDVSVDSTSAIFADARGHIGSTGEGAGESAEFRNGGGGGFGGAGGNASGSTQVEAGTGRGGDCYGFSQAEIFAPSLLGSGGGNYWNDGKPELTSGGFGGGVIKLRVDGALQLNGQISSRGGNGTNIFGENGGGGSGGSVFISCATLSGTGSVAAAGGNGATSSGSGGGGGGGRVALLVSSSPSLGSVTTDVRGGTGSGRGGAGTVYTRFQGQTRGSLIIDNSDAVGGETTELFNPSDELAEPLTLDANVFVRRNGRLGPAHGLTNFDLTILGNLTVEPNGAVSGDGRGFPGHTGPGRGGQLENANGGGGGYGGAGGAGSNNPFVPGGVTYGSATLDPIQLGSGGGNHWDSGKEAIASGGYGGGALRLNVLGTIELQGTGPKISARGGNGASLSFGENGGGGSGGSLFIQCGAVIGTGSISAAGGNGASSSGSGGGGGGGRVLVLSCTPGAPTISVAGGTGFVAGSSGTFSVQQQPNVVQQPQGTDVCGNGSAQFAVSVLGATGYQWQIEFPAGSSTWLNLADGTSAQFGVINGAQTATLTIDSLGTASASRYRCVISSAQCASVTSSAATLTVCRSDFNCNGTVNSTDVSDFINAWFTDQTEGTLTTDFDRNGVINSTDVSEFINQWFAEQFGPCAG